MALPATTIAANSHLPFTAHRMETKMRNKHHHVSSRTSFKTPSLLDGLTPLPQFPEFQIHRRKAQTQEMSSTRVFTGESHIFQQRHALQSVDVGKSRNCTPQKIIKGLSLYEALEIPINEMPSLRNKIHPLFLSPYWNKFDNEGWLNFKPVLQLATRLLTSEWAFETFWLQLVRPALERDNIKDMSASESNKDLFSGSGFTGENLTTEHQRGHKRFYDRYLKYIDELTPKVYFGFASYNYDESTSFTRLLITKGLTGTVVQKKTDLKTAIKSALTIESNNSYYPAPAMEAAFQPHRVAALKNSSNPSKLNIHVMKFRRNIDHFNILLPNDTLQRLWGLSALTRAHRLRFQFKMAVSLVSEIAESLAKFLDLPKEHISTTTPDGYGDCLAMCPGVAFQRTILGGILLEQSFKALSWWGGPMAEKMVEELLPDGWNEDTSAGLVLDKGIYTATGTKGVSFSEKEKFKGQIGPSRDMILLKSNWVSQWYSEENWEMLEWGKKKFFDGQTENGWEFWKLRNEAKLGIKGFTIFPLPKDLPL
jgi:hypothetical protein